MPMPQGASKTPAEAYEVLWGLEVRVDSAAPPYERAHFGSGWQQRDGCDMRNRILNRDLHVTQHRTGTRGCVVERGYLVIEPFTGASHREFERGAPAERNLDIEHVVSLHDAWFSGAYRWSRDERVAFSNDPLVLIAVDPGQNRARGPRTIDEWLPPNREFHCHFVARSTEIKHVWDLSVTAGERDAKAEVLRGC